MNERNDFPRFIKSAPDGMDLFDSHSQDRTADSIVSYIKGNEEHTRLIGLEGEYGAGKSNVIQMVGKKLQADGYHIFIYDAWSHQEDLQRRSFLEELTKDLTDHKRLKSPGWDDRLKNLLAKTIEKKAKTIPELSPTIIVSFFVLVLSPIAKVIADSICDDYKVLKLLVTSAPFAIGLIFLLLKYGFGRNRDTDAGPRSSSTKSRGPFKLAELLYIYKDKELETSTKESISEKEPSVPEFRNWMADLSKDMADQPNGKVGNLIVVFDNMDRLPADKVLILWSMVHTFFHESPHKNIYIIVPFDSTQLQEVFPDGKPADGKAVDGKLPEKARHFIEKTFPVLFSVSKPIATDWKALFLIKYKEAFEDTEQGDYNLVKNIFDLYHPEITPRKIIGFLNQLVILKMNRGQEIPLRYSALFVPNRDLIARDPAGEVIRQTYLEKAKYLFKTDDDVIGYITALAYNIPVETARQVALNREILVAFREKNIQRLEEISSVPHFWETVEDVLYKEEIDLEAIVATLQALERALNPERENPVIRDIWDVLVARQIQTAVDILAFTDTHRALLIKSRPPLNQKLLGHLSLYFRIAREFNGASYFQVMDSMDEFIKQEKLQLDLPSVIKPKPVSTDIFIDYIGAAREKYGAYKVTCDPGQLDDYLLSKMSGDGLEMKGLPYIAGEYQFPKLEGELVGKISSGGIDPSNIGTILDAYKSLSPQVRILPAKLTDQKINQLLSTIPRSNPGYYDLAAMRVARGPEFQPKGGVADQVLQVVDQEMVDAVADRVEYYLDLGGLLRLVALDPNPLLTLVTRKLVEGHSKVWQFNVLETLPLFENIMAKTLVPAETLFSMLDRRSEDLRATLNPSNLQEVVPGMAVYEIAGQSDLALSGILFAVALKSLEEADHGPWKRWFSDEHSYGFTLLIILLKTGKMSQLPGMAIDPYRETLLEIANRPEDTTVKMFADWERVYHSVDKMLVKGTISNIRDQFLNLQPMLAGKFLLFEPLLRLQGDLPTNPNTTRRLLTPVANDQKCLETIATHTDFYLPIISTDQSSLIDFVKAAGKLLAPESSPLLSSFGLALDRFFKGKVKIRKAQYGADGKSIDIAKKLKRLVDEDGLLRIQITNELAGEDPISGILKKLELDYEFGGTEYHVSINEGEWLKLPFG